MSRTKEQVDAILSTGAKLCSVCNHTKPLVYFGISNRSRDGYRSDCKVCHNTSSHLSAKKNPRVARKKSQAYKASVTGKYTMYKGSAKSREVEFSLTKEEFATFWQKPCEYCGSQIATVGIDRVDNSIGYELSNCVPCCTQCNTMKMDYSKDEWMDKMFTVLKFQGVI